MLQEDFNTMHGADVNECCITFTEFDVSLRRAEKREERRQQKFLRKACHDFQLKEHAEETICEHCELPLEGEVR